MPSNARRTPSLSGETPRCSYVVTWKSRGGRRTIARGLPYRGRSDRSPVSHNSGPRHLTTPPQAGPTRDRRCALSPCRAELALERLGDLVDALPVPCDRYLVPNYLRTLRFVDSVELRRSMISTVSTEFQFRAVSPEELEVRIRQPGTRKRHSKGADLVESFRKSNEVAATVEFLTTKDRNSAAISATGYARGVGAHIWIRKTGPLELLFIDLDQAPESVVKAHKLQPTRSR